jgi:SAM-dependent methyltransferase
MNKLLQSLLVLVLKSTIELLRRMNAIPLRPSMGASNSRKSIGRILVNNYINSCRNEIQGDILEIGRNVYRNQIPPQNVKSYICLDIESFDDIDIVADIQNMPQVSSNKFDTIICTQVLEHVQNPFLAAGELHRILKPGGKLIVTVPFLNNYHMVPVDYWRYTEFGLANLFKEYSTCKVDSLGSTYHHVLATLGFHEAEMKFDVLERPDVPRFPIIVTAIAIK